MSHLCSHISVLSKGIKKRLALFITAKHTATVLIAAQHDEVTIVDLNFMVLVIAATK